MKRAVQHAHLRESTRAFRKNSATTRTLRSHKKQKARTLPSSRYAETAKRAHAPQQKHSVKSTCAPGNPRALLSPPGAARALRSHVPTRLKGQCRQRSPGVIPLKVVASHDAVLRPSVTISPYSLRNSVLTVVFRLPGERHQPLSLRPVGELELVFTGTPSRAAPCWHPSPEGRSGVRGEKVHRRALILCSILRGRFLQKWSIIFIIIIHYCIITICVTGRGCKRRGSLPSPLPALRDQQFRGHRHEATTSTTCPWSPVLPDAGPRPRTSCPSSV